jgi:hypothetical protein
VTHVLEELRSRRRRQPFEPFVIVLNDGRRFSVVRKFQFGFNEERVLVLDERDLSNFFKPSDIAAFETLHPVS